MFAYFSNLSSSNRINVAIALVTAIVGIPGWLLYLRMPSPPREVFSVRYETFNLDLVFDEGTEKTYYILMNGSISIKNNTDHTLEIRVTPTYASTAITLADKQIVRGIIALDSRRSTILDLNYRQRVRPLENEALNNISRKTDDVKGYLSKNGIRISGVGATIATTTSTFCWGSSKILYDKMKEHTIQAIPFSIIGDNVVSHCALGSIDGAFF